MHTHTAAPARVQRVLIVDDQHTFAELLARVLDHEDGFATVGTANTAADALKMLRRENPRTSSSSVSGCRTCWAPTCAR